MSEGVARRGQGWWTNMTAEGIRKVSLLMRTVDAYGFDYAQKGSKLVPSRLDVERELAGVVSMAYEYQAWIDFYHSGVGDFADFMKQRPRTEGEQ